VLRHSWVLSLLLLAACDRRLEVRETGSLALGQNLYRAGALDVEGPEFASLAAQAQFARWGSYAGGLDVRWIGGGADAPRGSTSRGEVTQPARSHAGRMLLCDFSAGELASLPAAGALREEGGQLHLGPHLASAADCCLILVCIDPLRDHLPLTVVAGSNPKRLLSALPNLRPGWRREGLVFLRGRPWLRLDLERGGSEWTIVDRGTLPGSGSDEGRSVHGDLSHSGDGLVDHGQLAPNLTGTSEPGVSHAEIIDYGLACAAALKRAATITGEPSGAWRIHASSSVPAVGWPAELAQADEPTRTLQVLLPPGSPTDGGRNLAWAVLFANQPASPAWWLDAMSAWCAGLHQSERLGLLANHPERPTLEELITDDASGRHSPYLLRPLRAELIEWCRLRDRDPETSLAEFGEHLAGLHGGEPASIEFQATPRGAFLRADGDPGSRAGRAALENLFAAGATTIALAYDLCFDPDPGQGRAWQPQRALGSVLGDASWLAASAQARALGLEVQLWPTVLASHSGVPSSRLVRVFDEQRKDLYDQLAASTTHAALMAEASGARVVSIGYDLGQSLVTRLDEEHSEPGEWQLKAQRVKRAGWTRAISAARASFKGGVVLATEDIRRFDLIDLWPEVDALAGGLFPVFEGTDQGQIPLWRLKELFVEHLSPADQRAEELGLPLWIAPSGFRATLYAARGPGADGGAPVGGNPVNAERQAQLLEALGHGARVHGAGLLVWKLTSEERDLLGRGLGGERARDLLRTVLAP